MTRQEILDRLRQAMRDASTADVDWDNLTETDTIEALGFDSLSILDMIYDVQQAFELEFEAESVAGVKTVGDLVSFLETRVA